MEILARGVGRRKEAVAQVQIIKGTGQFLINNIPAQQYLHNNTCTILSVKSPLNVLKDVTPMLESQAGSVSASSRVEADSTTGSNQSTLTGVKNEETNLKDTNVFESVDTIVKVKGGGLVGQAEAIKLGLARALCELNPSLLTETNNLLNTDEIRKQLKDKGYLTQDSRVKERRKYGLKKARKATQYNKR
jgi:small subunit ribosomal protein S9